MSIEYDRCLDAYIPTCDYCGTELEARYTFSGAVDAKKQNGWHSFKDDKTEEWTDMCPTCQELMGTATPNGAQQDFWGAV